MTSHFKFLGQSYRFQIRNFCQGFIGPPDPVSNLRKYRYILPENATVLERKLHDEREKLQKWNEEFWTKHNQDFVKRRQAFIQEQLKSKKTEASNLNADEMSVFYKHFLDENWKKHFVYNFTWYRRNVFVTWLHFKVLLSKMVERRKYIQYKKIGMKRLIEEREKPGYIQYKKIGMKRLIEEREKPGGVNPRNPFIFACVGNKSQNPKSGCKKVCELMFSGAL